MRKHNRFNNSDITLQGLFNTALVRYKRGDNAGAANTMYNACRKRLPKNEDGTSSINLHTLQPTSGTIEDAIKAHNENKVLLTLKILKHLQLEFHYGRLVV